MVVSILDPTLLILNPKPSQKFIVAHTDNLCIKIVTNEHYMVSKLQHIFLTQKIYSKWNATQRLISWHLELILFHFKFLFKAAKVAAAAVTRKHMCRDNKLRHWPAKNEEAYFIKLRREPVEYSSAPYTGCPFYEAAKMWLGIPDNWND